MLFGLTNAPVYGYYAPGVQGLFGQVYHHFHRQYLDLFKDKKRARGASEDYFTNPEGKSALC